MKANREYRYVPFEVRQNEEGQTVLEGTVIRYGDVADIGGWFTEEFRAGWMENTADVKWANRMHVRSAPLATSDTPYLNIDDNGERMFASLTLPDTTYGRDVAVEISPERRLLRGFSVEFLTTNGRIRLQERSPDRCEGQDVRVWGGRSAGISGQRGAGEEGPGVPVSTTGSRCPIPIHNAAPARTPDPELV